MFLCLTVPSDEHNFCKTSNLNIQDDSRQRSSKINPQSIFTESKANTFKNQTDF